MNKIINKISSFGIGATERCFYTSATREGKRNFRKFLTFNKRGTASLKLAQKKNLSPSVTIYKRDVRDTGHCVNGIFEIISQKIPQLVVPELENCKLRPYVSYRVPDVVQSEFTSLDLYNAVYAPKVMRDFKAGQLAEDGTPLKPSEDELLTPEKALMRAKQSGCDIF